MKKKFAIYDRTVETQNLASLQDMSLPRVKDVERHVNSLGGMVLKVFTDLNHNGVDARPGFMDCMNYLKTGKVDGIAIYALPRLSVSGSAAIDDLIAIKSLDITFVSLVENINTDYKQQLFLWPVIRSLKAMNRAAHSRATSRGMKRAKLAGKALGRPGVPMEMLQLAVKYIRELEEDPVEAYAPWQIQKKCDISPPTYYKICDSLNLIDEGKGVEEIVAETKLGVSTAKLLVEIEAAEDVRLKIKD